MVILNVHDWEGRWLGRQDWWVYLKYGRLNDQITTNTLKPRYNVLLQWDFLKCGPTSVADPTELLREISRVSHEASGSFQLDYDLSVP